MMSVIRGVANGILCVGLLTACATPVEKSRLFQSSTPDIVTMLSLKPAGKDWHFILVPGGDNVKTLGFAAAADYAHHLPPTAVGVSALKKHLLGFYAHKQRAIYWKDYPPAGFRYPPAKQTSEIERFAEANDIQLQLLPVVIE
jgi:hypothetical protein